MQRVLKFKSDFSRRQALRQLYHEAYEHPNEYVLDKLTPE